MDEVGEAKQKLVRQGFSAKKVTVRLASKGIAVSLAMAVTLALVAAAAVSGGLELGGPASSSGGVGPTAAGDLERPVFSRSIVDSSGDVGTDTSITIGTDAYGLISYYDTTSLKVAHCSNVACSTAAITILDTVGNAKGLYTSIAIGADGLGLISYYDAANTRLKTAHCSNTACTAATLSVVDSGALAVYSSVTIGTDGLALISYLYGTSLKVAHCSNVACSTATLSTIDSGGSVGAYTSIAIGADGLGLISYYDTTNGHLKVGHCSNTVCTTATLATIDATTNLVGLYSSITIGRDGLGLISYWDHFSDYFKVAHCSNTACSTATKVSLEAGTGQFTSIAIGMDGFGIISYTDYAPSAEKLKVAHCSNTACTTAILTVVDGSTWPFSVGLYTSIAIGADGFGLIGYYDYANGDLKVAHLSNVFGTPFVRYR